MLGLSSSSLWPHYPQFILLPAFFKILLPFLILSLSQLSHATVIPGASSLSSPSSVCTFPPSDLSLQPISLLIINNPCLLSSLNCCLCLALFRLQVPWGREHASSLYIKCLVNLWHCINGCFINCNLEPGDVIYKRILIKEYLILAVLLWACWPPFTISLVFQEGT